MAKPKSGPTPIDVVHFHTKPVEVQPTQVPNIGAYMYYPVCIDEVFAFDELNTKDALVSKFHVIFRCCLKH